MVGDQGDGVRHVSSGPLNVVFLMRGHLYLVAASSRAEPVAALRAQLHLLHQHLLMLVTGGGWLGPGARRGAARRATGRAAWGGGSGGVGRLACSAA